MFYNQQVEEEEVLVDQSCLRNWHLHTHIISQTYVLSILSAMNNS